MTDLLFLAQRVVDACCFCYDVFYKGAGLVFFHLNCMTTESLKVHREYLETYPIRVTVVWSFSFSLARAVKVGLVMVSANSRITAISANQAGKSLFNAPAGLFCY